MEGLCICQTHSKCKLPYLSALKVKAKPYLAVGRGRSTSQAAPTPKSSTEAVQELSCTLHHHSRRTRILQRFGRENLASALSDVVPNPKQRERLLPDKNTPLGCHPRTGQWKQRVHVPAVLRVGMGRAEKPKSLDFCAACARSKSLFQEQIRPCSQNAPPGKGGKRRAGCRMGSSASLLRLG